MTKPEHSVLIVEDEAFTRMAAADAIGDIGIESYEAGDAIEALDVLEHHPEIGLIFSDVNMPGPIDGVALVHKAYELNPGVAILVTSGAKMIPDADLPDHGTFLPKPYSPQQLADAVRDKLGEQVK